MYIRLIVEKRVKINGRTDRFGTGDKWWLPVLVRTQSGHCPELRVAPRETNNFADSR
jgi:hypothetical protein